LGGRAEIRDPPKGTGKRTKVKSSNAFRLKKDPAPTLRRRISRENFHSKGNPGAHPLKTKSKKKSLRKRWHGWREPSTEGGGTGIMSQNVRMVIWEEVGRTKTGKKKKYTASQSSLSWEFKKNSRKIVGGLTEYIAVGSQGKKGRWKEASAVFPVILGNPIGNQAGKKKGLRKKNRS